MAKNELMTKATGLVNRFGFAVKKHSPEILLFGGLFTIAGGCFMACKATLKARDVIDEAKVDIESIHKCTNNPEIRDSLTEEQARKEINQVYVQTGLEVVKIYIPPVAVGATGVLSVLASHNIMNKRNAALAAAYATIDSSFKQYRNRVLERLGEEAECELRTGASMREIEEKIVDEKTGKEKNTKKTVPVLDENNGYSDYCRFFDKHSKGYETNSDYTDMFLRAQENIAQQKLVADRYLFLNDVYDLLGIERTVAGQVVGWLYDPNDPTGDNRVRFKRYDVYREDENGEIVPAILIDFNVDGYILNDIKERKLLNP